MREDDDEGRAPTLEGLGGERPADGSRQGLAVKLAGPEALASWVHRESHGRDGDE